MAARLLRPLAVLAALCSSAGAQPTSVVSSAAPDVSANNSKNVSSPRTTGWQDNFHVLKGLSITESTCAAADGCGSGPHAPNSFLCCNKVCGTIAPISLATAKAICDDNNGNGGAGLSNSCWVRRPLTPHR